MDKHRLSDQSGVSSYDVSWEKWRTEQVQIITQILSHVFKAEDEVQQMQSPSRLLRRSSINSPEEEAEIRRKLTQIQQQISEYEQMLKLGLERIENALEEMNAQKPASQQKSEASIIPLKKKTSFLKKWMRKFQFSRLVKRP